MYCHVAAVLRYKWSFIAMAASLAGFVVFWAISCFYAPLRHARVLHAEPQVIEAAFNHGSARLYQDTMQFPFMDHVVEHDPSGPVSGWGSGKAFPEFANWQCLREANRVPRRLFPHMFPSGKIQLYGEEELERQHSTVQRLLREGRYGAVHETRVSRPCFNRFLDKAVVYIYSDCGVLCGGGHVVLCVLENGQWMFKSSRSSWVS